MDESSDDTSLSSDESEDQNQVEDGDEEGKKEDAWAMFGQVKRKESESMLVRVRKNVTPSGKGLKSIRKRSLKSNLWHGSD